VECGVVSLEAKRSGLGQLLSVGSDAVCGRHRDLTIENQTRDVPSASYGYTLVCDMRNVAGRD